MEEKLDLILEQITSIKEVMVTKTDLEVALFDFAKKEELNYSISKLATKDELSTSISKLATKSELQETLVGIATKEYVNQATETILESFQQESLKADQDRKEARDRFEGIVEFKDDNMRIFNYRYSEVSTDINLVKSEINALDIRVAKLEEK